MGFSRHEYWSGFLYPSPGDLPDLGIKPMSLASPALMGGFFTPSATYSVSVSVQLLSHVRLFVTPWTAAHQAYLSITNSWSLPKAMSIESVMPSSHLILCRPLLLCLQSFLASGSFQMSQLFTSGGQSFGVSALVSVLPMNIQD